MRSELPSGGELDSLCAFWSRASKEAPPTSVGFTVAVYVAAVGPRVLGAVEAVQEAPGDLGHDRSVRDGLGHAVDGSLQRQQEWGRVSFPRPGEIDISFLAALVQSAAKV